MTEHIWSEQSKGGEDLDDGWEEVSPSQWLGGIEFWWKNTVWIYLKYL